MSKDSQPPHDLVQLIQSGEIGRLVNAASEAHRNAQAFLASPAWQQIVEKIEMLGRVGHDPALNEFRERISKVVLTYHQVVLPTADVIARLAEQTARQIKPIQSTLASVLGWQTTIAERMNALNRAWAFEGELGVSATGFARLVRLSVATRSDNPFAERTSELLREELGEPVDALESLAPAERDAAAMEAGLRPELIAFPAREYAGVVIAAGFRFRFAAAPLPVPIEGSDANSVFDPTHNAILTHLEQRLRQLVETSLSETEGRGWTKHRVPEPVWELWRARQDEDRLAGRPVYSAVHYADFMDLSAVIRRKDNWKVFTAIFNNSDDFETSLRRLHPIRKALAHSRPLSRADVLTLLSEATRIFTALGDDVFTESVPGSVHPATAGLPTS
jgi:hypothetical protein